jgi:hypothetical protein
VLEKFGKWNNVIIIDNFNGLGMIRAMGHKSS